MTTTETAPAPGGPAAPTASRRPARRFPWTDVVTTAAAFVLAFLVGAVLMIVSDTEVRSTFAYFFARPGDALGASWDKVSGAYAALLRIRQSARIRQIFWYTWLSADRDSPNSFSWSGLRKLGPPGTDAPVDKPALAEYRRVALRVEGR